MVNSWKGLAKNTGKWVRTDRPALTRKPVARVLGGYSDAATKSVAAVLKNKKVLAARVRVLWAEQERLDKACLRYPKSKKLKAALDRVNTELYGLGEI